MSIRPWEVHHEEISPADCGAAFGSFTFALVYCDGHDFLLGLAHLHGPWGVAVIPSTDRGHPSLIEVYRARTHIGF